MRQVRLNGSARPWSLARPSSSARYKTGIGAGQDKMPKAGASNSQGKREVEHEPGLATFGLATKKQHAIMHQPVEELPWWRDMCRQAVRSRSPVGEIDGPLYHCSRLHT